MFFPSLNLARPTALSLHFCQQDILTLKRLSCFAVMRSAVLRCVLGSGYVKYISEKR